MELRQLRYFLIVAEELNFTRAADRLHMAQPPLSQQIKALETELGVNLFHRTTRKVELTRAGEFFEEKIRDWQTELHGVIREARDIQAGFRGRVRIGFVGTATHYLMPQVLAGLKKQLPGIKVDVEGELLTPQIEDLLHRKKLDIAVIRPPVTSPEIEVEFLRSDKFEVCFSASDELAGTQEPLDIAELRSREFVSYPANSAAATAFYAACSKAGFLPNVVHETDRMSTLLTLVGVGAGIAVVPTGSGSPMRHPVKYRQIRDVPPIELAISKLVGQNSALIQEVSAVIRDELTNGRFS